MEDSVKFFLDTCRENNEDEEYCLIPSAFSHILEDEEFVRHSDIVHEQTGATHFRITRDQDKIEITFLEGDAWGACSLFKVVKKFSFKFNFAKEE